MPTPRLSDELAKEAADAFEALGNKSQAAELLGLPRNTFNSRLKIAAERGMCGTKPVLPGFRIAQISNTPNGDYIKQRPEAGAEFDIPAGHTIKGVSALVDADGRTIQQWIKTRNEYAPQDVAAILKEAFVDVPPAEPRALNTVPTDDLLTLTPLADFHVGLFAWHRETGANWDLSIAERVIGGALDELIARTPPSGHAIVLGGGDLLHSDSNENKTAKSGNVLQVDGRYQKVLMTACRLVVRAIDANLARHGHVTVRILPGNHDEHASVAVAYFLLAWYRNEPRVTVDVDPSLFFWFRFGRVLLGATHGHTVKLKDMASIMAHRRAEDWGATVHRFIHGFHIHHSSKYATEGNGVISESHQTPTPQDAWHWGAGFLSGRSMQSISYHREFGEVSRVRVAMMDAANDNEPAEQRRAA
ncbi:helix-turn-helix domain-containing protein [Rhizobium aethiopicum]|uniref:DNA binding HTH domain-containing protein n=1 Tax=Rhizobium aethiopicum TaxID=1138170 RepID=A0A7W6MIN3_9HYPH|nr:helix-turn-helix domain-containing protein [Rhizobium aethiopicum]MBB4192823.1 hypothetical protein [Rhizobium aethiopicum]